MRARIIVLVLMGAFTTFRPLPGQSQVSSSPGEVTTAPPDLWLAPLAPLPPILAPPAVEEPVALQDGPGMVPVLFGIFGAIAGMFVGDWWADRNCVEACGQTDIVMLFIGGALGAMLGYVIGGGEIPDPGPYMRGAP